MFNSIIKRIHSNAPLIHSITNYVTACDLANMLLAIGARPIMADDIKEVQEITKSCSALNINIGTLTKNSLKAMIKAGIKANQLNIPVVLDPVGCGSSAFRLNSCKKLLKKVKFAAIKGNISEILSLMAGVKNAFGVDANPEDKITDENMDDTISKVSAFAEKMGAVIVVTGAEDIVTDGKSVYVVKGGSAMMSEVTGTGCMLSGLLAAFIGATFRGLGATVESAFAAVASMKVCGELAAKRMEAEDGNASFKRYIIDAMFNLTDEQLEEDAKYEMQ